MRKRGRVPSLAALASLLLVSAGCDYLLRDLIPQDSDELALRVFDLVNAERLESGLEPLTWNDVIAAEAKQHSLDMAEGRVPFGHDGFSDRFARITQVIPASAGAENIAYASDAELAVSLWMDSSGHRDNILGNFDVSGVGAAWDGGLGVFYFTQIFICSR
ncbi:MAG: CAP domain-containing protein [Candidatus Aminicenantes bacterium]|nr:CAP domain-containing protein [Candidatus Aminicenantes bacterium]